MRAEQIRNGFWRARTEQPLDRAHGLHELPLSGRGQPREQRRHLVPRAGFERPEGGAPAPREPQQAQARVGGRRGPREEAVRLEAAEDAAHVSGAETEIPPEVGRRRRLAVRQLVQHPRLGQRKRTVEQVLVEHADPPRVEPVEGADGVEPAGAGGGSRSVRHRVTLSTDWLTQSSYRGSGGPVRFARPCSASLQASVVRSAESLALRRRAHDFSFSVG
jgi:hypothetical protein